METLSSPTDTNNACLEDARDKLRFWAIRDASVVLDVLKEYPQLAQETFFCGCVCNGKKGQSLSPLASLVAIQAPLDIVQQALDLYPDAALGNCHPQQRHKQQPHDPCLPLHVASATSGPNSFETVQYLVQRFPQTVSIPDASENLPLHHALQSPFEQASLPTIQCLVEHFPQGIVQENKNGETPLQYAIENAYSDEVVDYLASQLPPSFREFAFGNCLTLNLARCRAMTRLLPHLKSLTCRPSQWTWDGLVHLLETMTTSHENNKVAKLVLEWIPRAFFTSNHRMGQLLRDLLRASHSATTALCDVRLQIKNAWFDKNRNSDIQCLETLRGILCSALPPTKQAPVRFSLALHSFQLYNDNLEDFIRQAQPARLSLNCCTIFENTSLNSNESTTTPENVAASVSRASTTSWNQCHHLERLELIQTRMSNTIFQDLLEWTRQLQNLQHLKLIFPRTEDFGDVRGLLDLSDYVADMLPRLQTLTLEGLFVSPKLLARYAKPAHNNNSNHYTEHQMIMMDSTCYIEYIQYGQMWRNLQYYTALNHFGKPLLRHDVTQASKNNCLVVLKALENFEDIKEPEIKDQVRYGLLNECPSLWSSH